MKILTIPQWDSNHEPLDRHSNAVTITPQIPFFYLIINYWKKADMKTVLLLKLIFCNFDRSITFCFGVSSNLSQQKSPTAEILRIYFLRTIVWRKYLPKISAVGLFCRDKFEETPKQKVIDLSKLQKIYFRGRSRVSYKRMNLMSGTNL